MKSYICADRRRKPSWSSWSHRCQVWSGWILQPQGGVTYSYLIYFIFLFHLPVTRRYSVGGETKKEKKKKPRNPPPARPPRRLISSLSPNVKNTFVWLRCGQTASFLAPCLLCAAIQTLWAVLLLTWQQTNKKKKKFKMSAELSSDQTPCSQLIAPLTLESCWGTGCNWNQLNKNQTLVLSCMSDHKLNGFHHLKNNNKQQQQQKKCFLNAPGLHKPHVWHRRRLLSVWPHGKTSKHKLIISQKDPKRPWSLCCIPFSRRRLIASFPPRQ